MNKTIAIFIFLSMTATFSFADQADQVITLKDGSQIKGQLAGVENGVYTVKTPIIGDVHVSASDVASITNASASAAAAANNTNTTVSPQAGSTIPITDQQIMTQQQNLMANPQAMASLQEMAQDPDIMKALSDPDLVQAVTTHNYQAIQTNPKMQELMNNPKMQALLQKLAAQQQQQQTTSSQ
jgi:hypothetical protein